MTFFPICRKNFPITAEDYFQLSLTFISKIIEICFHRSLKNNKENACLYFSRKCRSLQLPITFSRLNEQFSVRSANHYTNRERRIILKGYIFTAHRIWTINVTEADRIDTEPWILAKMKHPSDLTMTKRK